MGDWQIFSCESCAANPILQDIQGCFKETRPIAQYDTFSFTRCPVTYQGTRTLILLRLGQDDTLARLTVENQNLMPAKRLTALRYVTFLLRLMEVRNGPVR